MGKKKKTVLFVDWIPLFAGMTSLRRSETWWNNFKYATICQRVETRMEHIRAISHFVNELEKRYLSGQMQCLHLLSSSLTKWVQVPSMRHAFNLHTWHYLIRLETKNRKRQKEWKAVWLGRNSLAIVGLKGKLARSRSSETGCSWNTVWKHDGIIHTRQISSRTEQSVLDSGSFTSADEPTGSEEEKQKTDSRRVRN